jgi:hypothetical protein
MELMKKIALLFLAVLPLFSFGQVFVNGEDINKKDDLQYIELSGAYVPKLKITIDYGQDWTKNSNKANQELQSIHDAQGQLIEFNTMVEAVNYLYKNGWEISTVYVVRALNGTDAQIYRYVLKRRQA